MGKRKNSRLSTISALWFVAVAVFLFGPTLDQAQAQEPRTRLNLAAGRVDHPHYALGAAIANTLTKQSSFLQVEPVMTPGYTDNVEILMGNPNDFLALCETSNMFYLPKLEKFKNYDKFRILGFMGYATIILCTFDKKVKTVKDLAGKKVNVHRKGGIFLDEYKAIYGAEGVWDKIAYKIYQGYGGGMQSMTDGTIDVAPTPFDFIQPDKYSKGADIQTAEARAPVYYVSLDKETLKRLYKENKAAGLPFRIPPGALDPKTQPEEVIAGVYPAFLIADAQMKENVVYEVTKIFYENSEKYSSWHPQGNNITKDTIPSYVFSKGLMHPGALRYYKENNIEVKDIIEKLP